MGRWNGYGGKLEGNETLEENLLREMEEEANIKPRNLEKMGTMMFMFNHKSEEIEVHLFKADDLEGEPKETEEMRPQWFDENNMPLELMWPDDKYWMPYFLLNKKFIANFTFADYDKIIEYDIKETREL